MFLKRFCISLIIFCLLLAKYIIAGNPQPEEINNYKPFIENKQQWNSNIKYKTLLTGNDIYFETDGFLFSLYDQEKTGTHHLKDRNHSNIETKKHIACHAYKMSFMGGNSNIQVTATNESSYYYNYFLGKDQSKWASFVRSYESIKYENIYDGIDVDVKLNKQFDLKYDFIVNAGANPNDIKLNYNGVDSLYLKNGNLNIVTSVRNIVESIPLAYQIINNEKIDIACKYELNDETIHFLFPDGYNHNYLLVIDPVVVEISTYGSVGTEAYGYCATYGENGTLYTGCTPFGVGYPVTLGAYDLSYNDASSREDIGISKFDSTGSTLLYATYLGGINTDWPTSLIIDNNNNLVILGTTYSSDFPVTTLSYDTSFNGLSDLLICKLSSDGSTLLASTFIGGSEEDGHNTDATVAKNASDGKRGEVIVDQNNQILVVSNTLSDDFPTLHAYQDTLASDSQDACLFKFTQGLDSIIWSSYLGGTRAETGYSILLGDSNDFYISGVTSSNNFPVTIGAYNELPIGGGDGFVSRFLQDTLILLNSTYIGTDKWDGAYFVDSDPDGNIYILGQTEGVYPISDCKYNTIDGSLFLHKINKTLSVSFFSTNLGTHIGYFNSQGRGTIPTAFLVDDCGKILIASHGYIGDQETTKDAFQDTCGDIWCEDFYIMILSEEARRLNYATYLGGSGPNGIIEEHSDGGTCRFDKDGTVYLAICTDSKNFPTNSDDWQPTNPTGSWGVVGVKIRTDNIRNIIADIEYESETVGCAPFEAKLKSGDECFLTYSWNLGLTANDTLTGGNISYEYTTEGNYTIRLIVKDTAAQFCVTSDTAYGEIIVKEPKTILFSSDTSICRGDSALLFASGVDYYQWTPTIGLSNASISNPIAFPDTTTTYTIFWNDTICEADTGSITVSVYQNQNVVCCDDTIVLGSQKGLYISGDGTSFNWTPSINISCNDCSSPTVSPEESTIYSVLIETPEGCTFKDSVLIVVVNELLQIPNVFSPNGDDKNDQLQIFHQGIINVKYLRIYNRWGQVVYETTNLDQWWDGKYKGEIQENNIYVLEILANSELGNEISMVKEILLMR